MKRTPLKVLMFIDSFQRGGSERQFVYLANRLADDERIDLRLGCLRREGSFLEDLRSDREDIREYPLERFYDLNGARQIMRLAAYLRRERIAVVHSWDFYSNVMCAAATLAAPRTRFIPSRRYLKLTDRRLHKIGEAASLHRADAVIFNSRRVADHVGRQHRLEAHQITVIPNGLELDRFVGRNGSAVRKSHSSGDLRIGMLARLDPRKDHVTLLRAAADLVPDWPGLEVVLMGDGPQRPLVESEVKNLGLGRHVKMLGTVTEVEARLSELDIAVLTSRFEAMPNAVLEYLAAGLPVVVTNVGGIPEIVRDGRDGLLVPPGEPRALSDALEELLRNPVLRTSLGRAARLRAREFSMKAMTRRTTDLYFRLAGDGLENGSAATIQQRTS